jgi:UDP-N-acetylmuramoyl-tripeptide--D-alanyl-D-alanine ligase
MATPIGSNQVALDAPSVARATGGSVLRAAPGRRARGVTTDSRAVAAGSAFVALRGEVHDGHRFVPAAIDAGAALVVVERGRAGDDARADAVEVDDTLVAWGALGREHLRAWREGNGTRRVVAITGSAGKTTTKELAAAILGRASARAGGGEGACHATAGNLNNRVGLPAVVLQLEARHRYAVLEMGMSLRGEIAALAEIAPPDVGVVVNVGLAHAGGVGGTIDDVAEEKGGIFRGLRPGGVAVANADDPAVMAQASRVTGSRAGGAGAPRERPARVVTFGRAAGSDVRLAAREADGVVSRVVVERAGRRAAFVVPIPGEAAALDFVAALAAAEAAAGPIDDADVAAALAGLGAIAGRMNVVRLGDVTVVDDAYNANPGSMRAALAALSEMPALRRVAILGEMKELGPASLREHVALADAVAAAGVALLVSCGGMADDLARAVAPHGVDVAFCGDASGAARAAVDRVRPGDVVLVKASRSVGAERVVAALAERAGAGARTAT